MIIIKEKDEQTAMRKCVGNEEFQLTQEQTVMLIFREAVKMTDQEAWYTLKKKSSMHEALSLEDVVGLAGFDGYLIQGPCLYIDNVKGLRYSGLKIVRGAGSVSSDDISLVWGKEVVLSFPVKSIKSIGTKSLNILFVLNDGTAIEFFR